MDASRAKDRQEALTQLPVISGAPDPNYSTNQASRMVGKTVKKVEVGSRQEIEGVHQSEVIIIHFTDGSLLAIDTGSNAENLDCKKHRPEDFHVDFRVQWVPPSQ